MIFVYNFLQVVLLIITFPLLLLFVLSKNKYRSRFRDRLGFTMRKKMTTVARQNQPVIWLHALSVGEVTSALPLVRGLRKELPHACIVFSAATSTGMNIAQEKIGPYADIVIAAPLDLLPVVGYFVRCMAPDMFILVETDFWPNWLHALRKRSIPIVLVNGRISHSSFARYQRLRLFFTQLFRSFALLSMQTENDAGQIRRLGVPADRIRTLGNLKYDTLLHSDIESGNAKPPGDPRIPEKSLIVVCGSTHPGEEELLLSAFESLRETGKDIFLMIAPRDPGRGGEIHDLIAKSGLSSMRRTRPDEPAAPILILDTIGELAGFYRCASVAFIGGSLVDSGGHNPLEAAACGVPVLFGPHMEDFFEIARDLRECGGAMTVNSAAELHKSILRIIGDQSTHQQMSEAARTLVERNSGVVQNHIRELKKLFPAGLQ